MDPSALVALGFLDGANICSLSILALFLSVLHSASVTRRAILLTGSVYVLGVFATYLSVGLGLLTLAIAVPAVPHLMARIAGGAMIFVGSVNMINYYLPGTFSLSLAPSFTGRVLRHIRPAGLSTAMVAGLLAGIHNFPCACTGGIYPTFISLIAESANRFLYLLLYNVAAVAPLLAVLYISSSKTVTLSLRRWQQVNRGRFLFVLGLMMTIIGIVVLALAASGVVH